MTRTTVRLDAAEAEVIDGRQIRAVVFDEVRMAYLREVLAARGSGGNAALVLGGGKGVLARSLAGAGFDVVSVDASPEAVRLARQATAPSASVTYAVAPAEAPGVAAGAFDVVYVADTLEITADVDAVIAAAAAALKPGGTLVYDTVNRTLVARLVYLAAFQAIPATRIMPPGRYTARRLRTPAEISDALRRHGLRPGGVREFKPASVARLVTAVRTRKRGAVTDEQMAETVPFVLKPGGRPVVTYLGHAAKPA